MAGTGRASTNRRWSMRRSRPWRQRGSLEERESNSVDCCWWTKPRPSGSQVSMWGLVSSAWHHGHAGFGAKSTMPRRHWRCCEARRPASTAKSLSSLTLNERSTPLPHPCLRCPPGGFAELCPWKHRGKALCSWPSCQCCWVAWYSRRRFWASKTNNKQMSATGNKAS